MKQETLALDMPLDDAAAVAPEASAADPAAAAGQRPYVISQLEVFNWGPFGGLHRIPIDPHGTAIIGQTGSGKTTLVDALMTLIAERPLYNLASTGGHESDRDLISYIRGVSGAGDGSGDDTHIARRGATVTALSARFDDGARPVSLGALLWLDGSSSAMSDLKRLWLFSQDAEQGVADWLPVLREGGARGLKRYLREQGITPFDAKGAYLTKVQRFFEVGRNAFSLLNRAAGLKQLNSVDQLFRELVLEDRSAFGRAAEAVEVFDVLTGIHEELQTARRQQQSLLPIEVEARRHRERREQEARLTRLQGILPIWFAGHGLRLWEQRLETLVEALEALSRRSAELEQEEGRLEAEVEARHRAYIEAGGGNIQQLEQLVANQRGVLDQRRGQAQDYSRLVGACGLEQESSAAALERNRQQARRLRAELRPRLDALEADRDRHAGAAYNAGRDTEELQRELEQAKAHAHSNLPGNYLAFKQQLARALDLAPDDIAYLAELVEVKPAEQAWRGAIERALGGQRLRLVIPAAYMERALDWVNRRYNRLYVRLLDAGVYAGRKPAQFMADGYTRKLNYAKHPLREAAKHFLAEHDLHCVDDTEALSRTPHALTVEGTVAGRQGRFDKQDQRPLDQGWLTGFDNRDRLRQLQSSLDQARQRQAVAAGEFETAKAAHRELEQRLELLAHLEHLEFEHIDVAAAAADLARLQAQLRDMQDPASDAARAKQGWEEAKQALLTQRLTIKTHEREVGRVDTRRQQAEQRLGAARKRHGSGLSEERAELAGRYLPVPDDDALERLEELEREAAARLNAEVKGARDGLNACETRLVRLMGLAKREDTGALAEAGTEIRDVPQYLRRLEVLTKEALPEKLERFLGYLNKSSDESITQVLAHIDNEVSIIEERIAELNETLVQVDFQPGRYLQLEPRKVLHRAVTEVHRAQKVLRSAMLEDDQGESHYRALLALVGLLRNAVEHRKTAASRALLDPRYRLQFFVKVIERDGRRVIETRTGSQGGSGGEKEIIASYILTASLSYALCPAGMGYPLFGTVVLDEAFSKSSRAVAARIIQALHQFGLHPLFITPNKEMRLLREHTRSAVLVHKRDAAAVTTSLRWEELDRRAQRRLRAGTAA